MSNHPTREHWEPGAGGLCLHSIITDRSRPGRMWAGISAVGVFGTNDGGQTWEPMNRGVRADFSPERFPDYGQCPHKVLAAPEAKNLLYQQNHYGVYRSQSGGLDWQDITEGLPSQFGVHAGPGPRRPEHAVRLARRPVAGTGRGRRSPLRVRWQVQVVPQPQRGRRLGGVDQWTTPGKQLPPCDAGRYGHRPARSLRVYLGATSVQIYYSRDGGDSWEQLVEQLPPINSLTCALVARSGPTAGRYRPK